MAQAQRIRALLSGPEFRDFVLWLDTDSPLAQRPDSHLRWTRKKDGQVDCVHYCLPGPLDHWLVLLASALELLGQAAGLPG